jgi:hypothetical protein
VDHTERRLSPGQHHRTYAYDVAFGNAPERAIAEH